MAAVWDMPLDPALKLVALALADYADEHGVSYPSIRTLSAKTRFSERTVQRHLSALCRIGALSREERTSSSGRSTSCRYRLNLQWAEGEGVKLTPSEGVNLTPEGDTGVTP